MTHRLLAALLTISALAGAAVATAATTFYNDTPRGHQVAITPTVRFVNTPHKAPADEPLYVEVAYTNLHFMPEMRSPNAATTMARSPQTVGEDGLLEGHIHVYIHPTDSTTVRAFTFCILTTELSAGDDGTSGVIGGPCGNPLPKGDYRVIADVQGNYHDAPYKAHPQDLPAADVTTIRVK